MNKTPFPEELQQEMCAFSENEVWEMMNDELNKPPEEIDADLVAEYAALLESAETDEKSQMPTADAENGKRKGLKKKTVLLIAAAAIILIAVAVPVSARYAETTAVITTQEESKQNAEYEEDVSRRAQEIIDSVKSLLENRPLRDDVDVEKMIRSKITERLSDLEGVENDYEEYKKASGVQTDASFEEEITRIRNSVLAQETILEDYLAGRISGEEAQNRSMIAAFSSQFDVAE
ncbi:MAG: hypothetical protein IJL26_00465 [Clostridia bacterium]|nr:hypothetical protein [Clostridia bacterium]